MTTDVPYLNVDIDIRREAVSFSVGDMPYRGTPDFSEKTLENLATLREEGTSQQYGEELLKAAFRDEAHDGYHRIKEESRRLKTVRLRLSIDLAARELHQLWWECLFDSEAPPLPMGQFHTTPLSRYLHVAIPKTTARAVPAEDLRILAVVSSPTDLTTRYPGPPPAEPVPVDAEIATLREAVRRLGNRVCVEVLDGPATRNSINQRLMDGGFHILHLVGHGGFSRETDSAYMVLETDAKLCNPVGETELADMVSDLPELRLVVLLACHGAERSQFSPFVGLAPRMVRAGVPAVVAMQDRVSFETAHLFARRLYETLGTSSLTMGFIDTAVNVARRAIALAGSGQSWDWPLPVLFMAGDGKLVEPPATTPSGAGRGGPGAGPAPAHITISPGAVQPTDWTGPKLPGAGVAENVDAGPQSNTGPSQPFVVLEALRETAERDLDLICSQFDIDTAQLSREQKARVLFDHCFGCGQLDKLARLLPPYVSAKRK